MLKAVGYSSPLLYQMANRSAERARNDNSHEDAILAVLVSFLALEAFINDFHECALRVARIGIDEPAIKKLAYSLTEVEASKEGLGTKIQLIAINLQCVPFDKGTLPFQDFELLRKIRNHLVHARPEALVPNESETGYVRTGREKALSTSLRAKGLQLNETGFRWFEEIGTPEVAEWAIGVAKTIAISLTDLIPTKSRTMFFPNSWCQN